jgi:hypothetical protein
MMIDSSQCGLDTAYRVLNVLNGPVSYLTSNTQVVCQGQAVQFTQHAAGALYKWNFGTGSSFMSTLTGNVSFTFMNPGTYTVRSVVLAGLGASACTDTSTIVVTVLPRPTASIQLSTPSACGSAVVSVTAVRVWMLPRVRFDALLRGEPDLMLHLSAAIGMDLARTRRALGELQREVDTWVAGRLRELDPGGTQTFARLTGPDTALSREIALRSTLVKPESRGIPHPGFGLFMAHHQDHRPPRKLLGRGRRIESGQVARSPGRPSRRQRPEW